MNRAVLKYLAIAIGFAVVWILLEHVLGFNTARHEIGQYTRNATMIFFWVTIFLVIRETKKSQGNQLTFLQGFKTGVMYTVLFSLAFVLIILLYVQLINPDFYVTYKEFTMNQLVASHATPKQIKDAMREVDMSYNGSFQSYAVLFLFSTIFGVVISLIAALIYRTKSGS
ncbi:MAG: DUF4199 domain-containing protein [Chitinophagaceae bacterium]|nr:DUF4199 domain-containing protein [Chitinophagaceae bacterium]